jgi:SAM-dependent methyltransferase
MKTMTDHYRYPGEELYLFEKVRNWKKYFSRKLQPYIYGDVLEVGAGIGETTPFLLNARVNQWVCLEPDLTLFNILEQKLSSGKLPEYCIAKLGTVADLPSYSLFDTIIYIDVLEHIKDDKGELALVIPYLKKGGQLIVLSPAYQILYSPFDKAIGHYRRYTKKIFRTTVTFTNLIERKMFYLEAAGVFLLLLNKFLVRKKYPSEKDIWIWETLFVPLSKLLDKILFYRFGKSIVGIWQKL